MLAGGCAMSKSSADGESWALLADIHIAADAHLVQSDVNMTRNMERVAKEVLAWPDPVSGALINGDLAYNSGEVADYQAILGLLRPMREGACRFIWRWAIMITGKISGRRCRRINPWTRACRNANWPLFGPATPIGLCWIR